MVSLTAFLLDYSPWGIRLASLLISLASLTVLACVAAYWGRVRLPPEERFMVHITLRVPWPQEADWLDRLLTLILVLVVIAAIAAMLYAVVMPAPRDAFTEFYLLGPDGQLGGYPETIARGESVAVTLRLANHEQADVEYRIETIVEGVGEEIAHMQLSPEEAWEQPYTFTPTGSVESQRVEFLLYKGEETDPYRSLHLWITVREE